MTKYPAASKKRDLGEICTDRVDLANGEHSPRRRVRVASVEDIQNMLSRASPARSGRAKTCASLNAREEVLERDFDRLRGCSHRLEDCISLPGEESS
jgi:hypothetical protein